MFRPGRGRRDQPDSSGTQRTDPDSPAEPHAAGAVQTAEPGCAAEPDGAAAPDAAAPAAKPAPDQPARTGGTASWPGQLPAWVRHIALVVCYIAAGIAVTWPRLTYLRAHRLPASPDVSSYVWALWWVPHQLAHLANPWFTTYMAAPVGTQLGFNTLMPLPALLLWPVTAVAGPVASFNVLTLITPGLACYAMYRAARLWLNVPASIAAGALFGLSSMLDWQNWYHINLSLGTVFLPLTLEALIRLRRGPTIRRGIGLGLALAGSLLVNQESTVLALMLTVVVLVPWLIGMAIRDRPAARQAALPLGAAALTAVVVASPQLLAMAQQALSGGASVPAGELAANSTLYGAGLPTLFSPSPRLASYGLAQLTTAYQYTSRDQELEGLATFGAVLTALALLGAVAAWRKRSTWGFAGLWLGCAVLALGPFLVIGSHAYYPLLSHVHRTWIHATTTAAGTRVPGHWAPVPVSNLMPYAWLMRIPGLSGLREADRFALLGLVGAALLAGLAVQWLLQHARIAIAVPLLIVVAAVATLEAGWPGTKGLPGAISTMRASIPKLTAVLVRDHSRSIVVDVPFGLRGGLNLVGSAISVRALLLATQDGHPRAVSYTSWVPEPTIRGITLDHPFYARLIESEAGGGGRGLPTCTDLRARQERNPAAPAERCISAAQLRAAHADAVRMDARWVIVWLGIWHHAHPKLRYSNVEDFLHAVGFRRVFAYIPGYNHVWLYRLDAR